MFTVCYKIHIDAPEPVPCQDERKESVDLISCTKTPFQLAQESRYESDKAIISTPAQAITTMKTNNIL